MTILDNMGDEGLLVSTSDYTNKNPATSYKRRRPVKGEPVNKMDQTCIDTDDDDFEFEDARKEEQDDVMANDISAFMVSRGNITKHQFDLSQGQSKMIKDKVLDSQFLESEEHKETGPNEAGTESGDYKAMI